MENTPKLDRTIADMKLAVAPKHWERIVERWMFQAAKAITDDLKHSFAADMKVAKHQWKNLPWYKRLFV